MQKNRKRFSIVSTLVILILVACAAQPTNTPLAPTLAPPAPTINLNPRAGLTSRWLMNWDAQARKTWYLTPQGSLMMPMDIFLALKTADGARLFSSREHLATYGWVYPPDSDKDTLTMLGLPVGFVQEPDADNENIMTFGVTCAACHTGELIVNNVRYVVDGAPTMTNVQNWDMDVAAALGAVAGNDARLREMQEAIRARNPQSPYAQNFEKLKSDVDAVFQYEDGRAKRNTAIVDFGWGRLDAFTQIFNELLVHAAQLEQKDANGNYINVRPPASPISYPYLWNVPDLFCVQTNCVAQDPMTRNLGEVLGVYGRVRLRVLPDSQKINFNDLEALATIGDLFNISANPNNLYELEHQLVSLPVPKWQTEFGALNPDLVKRGAEIYASVVYDVQGTKQSCATCHVYADRSNPANLTPPNKTGHQFFQVTRWAPTITGTDAAFLENQTYRTVTGLPPLLDGMYDALIFENQPLLERFTKKEPKYAIDFFGLTTGLAMQKWYTLNRISPAEQARYMEYHQLTAPDDLYRYKARPLNGIAFTAPYLHNGSVPTLEELFKKPSERAKTFSLGTLEWDTTNVGYKISDTAIFDYPKFIFDTNIQGNRNTGHEWGTELSEADKKALIEFLKSQ